MVLTHTEVYKGYEIKVYSVQRRIQTNMGVGISREEEVYINDELMPTSYGALGQSAIDCAKQYIDERLCRQ